MTLDIFSIGQLIFSCSFLFPTTMWVVCGKGQCVMRLFICNPYHTYLHVMHVTDTHIWLHEDKIDSLIVIKRVVMAVILNFISKSFWRHIYIKSYKEGLFPSSTTKLNYPWKWWSFYFFKKHFLILCKAWRYNLVSFQWS